MDEEIITLLDECLEFHLIVRKYYRYESEKVKALDVGDFERAAKCRGEVVKVIEVMREKGW